jgi:hypothetical protein
VAGSGGLFTWATSKYNGDTGALITFPTMPYIERRTGELLHLTGVVPRRNSQVFLNGQRQQLNRDYIENSILDLIGQSGIFETSLSLLYNDDSLFFEDFPTGSPSVLLTADLIIFTADNDDITVDLLEY